MPPPFGVKSSRRQHTGYMPIATDKIGQRNGTEGIFSVFLCSGFSLSVCRKYFLVIFVCIFSTLIVFCGNQSERGIQLIVPHTISGGSPVPGCGRGKNYYFIYRIRQKVIYIINLFEHFLYSQSTYKLVRVAAALVSDRKIELSIDFPSSIPERQMRLIFPRWMDIYYFTLASEQIVIEINSVSGEIFALSSPVHTTTTTIIISAHWEIGRY